MSDSTRILCLAIVIGVAVASCSKESDGSRLNELQKVKGGNLDVVLLSPNDALNHGNDSLVLAFRSPADGSFRNVSTVKANATMAMAGMAPMFGAIDVRPSDTRGRYMVSADLGMAGTWQVNVKWEGPEGLESTTLRAAVG